MLLLSTLMFVGDIHKLPRKGSDNSPSPGERKTEAQLIIPATSPPGLQKGHSQPQPVRALLKAPEWRSVRTEDEKYAHIDQCVHIIMMTPMTGEYASVAHTWTSDFYSAYQKWFRDITATSTRRMHLPIADKRNVHVAMSFVLMVTLARDMNRQLPEEYVKQLERDFSYSRDEATPYLRSTLSIVQRPNDTSVLEVDRVVKTLVRHGYQTSPCQRLREDRRRQVHDWVATSRVDADDMLAPHFADLLLDDNRQHLYSHNDGKPIVLLTHQVLERNVLVKDIDSDADARCFTRRRTTPIPSRSGFSLGQSLSVPRVLFDVVTEDAFPYAATASHTRVIQTAEEVLLSYARRAGFDIEDRDDKVPAAHVYVDADVARGLHGQLGIYWHTPLSGNFEWERMLSSGAYAQIEDDTFPWPPECRGMRAESVVQQHTKALFRAPAAVRAQYAQDIRYALSHPPDVSVVDACRSFFLLASRRAASGLRCPANDDESIIDKRELEREMISTMRRITSRHHEKSRKRQIAPPKPAPPPSPPKPPQPTNATAKPKQRRQHYCTVMMC
ncbi:MAG: hypothetical protein MHM6MM_004073 [Cercozoa sp. M6MM]